MNPGAMENVPGTGVHFLIDIFLANRQVDYGSFGVNIKMDHSLRDYGSFLC